MDKEGNSKVICPGPKKATPVMTCEKAITETQGKEKVALFAETLPISRNLIDSVI